MIDVKELRIGNLVKYDNRVFTIHTIAKEFPTLDTSEFGIGVVDWNNLEPIELTEEWLIKFGFVNGNDGKFYYEGRFTIYNRFGHYGLIGGSLSWNEFHYVHQLQNIFYALTGEELTIKN